MVVYTHTCVNVVGLLVQATARKICLDTTYLLMPAVAAAAVAAAWGYCLCLDGEAAR